MYKFTIFFLLCVTLLGSPDDLLAQNPDINLLKEINHSSSGLHDCSKFISNTTTLVGLGTPVVMGATALIKGDDELLKNAIYVGVSIGVDGAITYSLKHLVGRSRPAVSYPTQIDAYENVRSNSFPSGHTSLAFATATALTLKYPKWYVALPGYAWACSVGYSRMNLGVHYPSDVLAGAVIGAGSAYITYKLNSWFWEKRKKATPNLDPFSL